MMKTLILTWALLVSSFAQAAPPTGIKGQDGTINYSVNAIVPYNQATKLAGNNVLIETGNANVLADPGAEATTTPWSAYKDAAGVLPVDGTAGTALYVTCANSATSPLAGTKSFLITKTANNAQGEGCSIPFTIPTSSIYKVNRLAFDYAIASGTYTDDQVEWFVYDVTNGGTPKPFTPSKLKNHSLPSETFAPNGEFQASDSTSYRLIAHIAGTSASAYSLKFDNFKLGVYEKTYGSVVTDWVSYTPTISNLTTTGASGKYRKVGDKMEISISAKPNGSSVGTILLSIPSGYSIDTTKLSSGSSLLTNFGTAFSRPVGSTRFYEGAIVLDTTSTVKILDTAFTSANYWGTNYPAIWDATGDTITANFSVPIAGWSSSQIMSNDADTRVIALSADKSSAQSIANATATTITFGTVNNDNTGSYNSATGVFTSKIPSWYNVSTTVEFAAGTAGYRDVSIALTGTGAIGAGSIWFTPSTAAQTFVPASRSVWVPAGGTIAIQATQNSGAAMNIGGSGASYNHLSITSISGPSQIAASESVSASYWLSANFAASSTVPINFDSKEFDSHNSVTVSPTAWKFTAQSPGEYSISSELPLAVAGGDYIKLYKNGTAYKQAGYVLNTAGTGKALVKVKLLQGDYIDLRPSSALTFSGGVLNGSSSNITITRTGNY